MQGALEKATDGGSIEDMRTAPSRAMWLAVGLALLLPSVGHASVQQSATSGGCSVAVTTDGGSGQVTAQTAVQSGDGRSCIVQRSAGGNSSQSIEQSQTFDDDGGAHHARRRHHRDSGEVSAEAGDVRSDAHRSDDRDCQDFSSQSDAQRALDEDSRDAHNLDADDDGRACEDSFAAAVHSTDTPRSGIETGGGGTLHTEPARSSDIPMHAPGVAILGAVLATTLVGAGVFGLRRTRRR